MRPWSSGAQALVVHHPLLLTPVSSVAATSAKGRVLHRLIRHGIALYTAHTSADVPPSGVNDAIARTLGLTDVTVLAPTDQTALDKLAVFVPADAAEAVRRALAQVGAGHIGAYDSCSWTTSGTGRFRPLEGADPAIGTVGAPEVVAEDRVECILPRSSRSAAVAALRAAHPYEEPAFDITEIVTPPGGFVTGDLESVRGHGRVGMLPEPLRLRAFADLVAQRFPATAHGVRVAGDPDRVLTPGRARRRQRGVVARGRSGRRSRGLPHLGPQAPPGRGVPRGGRRTGPGRHRPLGSGVDLAPDRGRSPAQ